MFKKPIILAIGCSYTTPNFRSRLEFLPSEKRSGWPMWPEVFKNNLEKETGKSYELINLGLNGGGHDYMTKQLLTYLAKYQDKIRIVLWGGTQFHRRTDPVLDRTYNSMSYNFMKGLSREKSWKYFCEYGKYNTIMNEFSGIGVKNTINMNLSYFWTILNICNSYNIKFLYYQLLHPLPHYQWIINIVKEWKLPTDGIMDHACETGWQSNYMLETAFAKDIIKNKKSFLGFQMFGEEAWDRQSEEEKEKFRILPVKLGEIYDANKVDGHPNAAGQKDIGNKVWKHYVRNLA